MKLLFILDPLDRLAVYKDTSIAIMRAAVEQGHTLFICEQHDMGLQHEKVYFHAQAFHFVESGTWYKVNEKASYAPDQFDAIFMRKDPPFDNEFLYSTYLLSLAQAQGGNIINNPTTVRSWNEKLAITQFPQFAPPFIVTANQSRILKFLSKHQDIIIKPLDGMGGKGIFRLKEDDPNVGAILETTTKMGQETVMVQRYLPEILQGDKRILIINGEPLPYALARIPKTGETRGNLAAGGKGVAQALSAHDQTIAQTVGPVLKEAGLFLVGLDVIGDHITEINVTSPTGMVEIAQQTDCNPAKICIDSLEALR